MSEGKAFKGIIHTDYFDRPATNTIIYSEIVKFPCPECGEEADVDIGVVLTSYPGQYTYHCPHCGKSGSILCSEVDTYRFHKDVQREIGQYIRGKSFYGVECIICGEETHQYNDLNKPYVCPKCKKAVMTVRKILEEKDD